MAIAKSRIATSANLKTKKSLGANSNNNNSNHGSHHSTGGGSSTSHNNNNSKEDNGNILLARGLSARYCGANISLGPLTSDEIERDLRHMEAFSNACIAYAQQFFIYQNSASLEENGKKVSPMVAMPVRIDPEEEKRLVNLRLKIQQCEAQREILESQYLSLRAHYVYMSQRLKNRRQSVNDRVEFLQDLLRKRGRLVALQRARLQISREVLACLHYRQSGGKPQGDEDPSNDDTTTAANNSADLVDIWNKIDEQFKQAEDACRGDGVEPWQALKVPKIPPGVPLLLSPLAKPPGFAAAWSTSGVFGSKKESLCWLEAEFPEPSHRTKSLSALREEVDFLKHELQKEQILNRDLQTEIISRRKANVELIAMMALLRTETEAVVARHNILLESDFAKDAAMDLHMQHDDEELAPSQETEEEEVPAGEEDEELAKGSAVETKTTGTTTPAPTVPVDTAVVLDDKSKKKTTDDEENDGDDEGEVEEEEEEDEGDGLLENGAPKRTLDEAVEASPRMKRRKL